MSCDVLVNIIKHAVIEFLERIHSCNALLIQKWIENSWRNRHLNIIGKEGSVLGIRDDHIE